MTLKAKISKYAGWEVEKLYQVRAYNSTQNSTIMQFRLEENNELRKRGYVVCLKHFEGGEAKVFLKSKFEVQEFIHFI